MESDKEASLTLSQILRDALDTNQDGQVSVGEIADRVAERGYGLLLILLALPTMIPVLPPGASAVVGLLYALIAVQMLWGLPRPWLPARVRAYSLSPKTVRALQQRGIAFMERLERFSRPRLPFMESAVAWRLLALIILAIGVILFLPLPFYNTLPALALMVIGVGFLNHDGVFLLVGALVCLALILFLLFFSHWLFALLNQIKTWL